MFAVYGCSSVSLLIMNLFLAGITNQEIWKEIIRTFITKKMKRNKRHEIYCQVITP